VFSSQKLQAWLQFMLNFNNLQKLSTWNVEYIYFYKCFQTFLTQNLFVSFYAIFQRISSKSQIRRTPIFVRVHAYDNNSWKKFYK